MSEQLAPRKSDQDMLDAAICALVGFVWRSCDRNAAAMIGDLQTGYMIAPVSDETRHKLRSAAEALGVAFV